MIGAAGTATAFGIVRTLRDNWGSGVEILAADAKPRRLVGSAFLSDDFVQSPLIPDASYRAWLERTLGERRVDLYVPLIDEDIKIAAELEGNGFEGQVAAPPPGSARITWDKLNTFRWLRDNAVPTPDTWAPAEAPRRPGELVVKSRRGQGSVGFGLLATLVELEALDDESVVQSRCSRPEVTIDCFLAGDGGRFRAVCRERLEVKAGVCTQARVFEDEELTALAERVARGLDLRGGCCIQAMKGGEGEWLVTDVNSRPGAGGRLSTAAGTDILGAVYADLLGLSFDYEGKLAPLPREVFVVRQFDEYIVE
jgi:carbamoylphosphate synthase large subunit